MTSMGINLEYDTTVNQEGFGLGVVLGKMAAWTKS